MCSALKFPNNGQLLITGGAGFVGANLAVSLKTKYSDLEIIALDNLKRRGSELNIKRLNKYGIQFIHGDIRNKEDINFENKKIALIIECSAEPSVLAGFGDSPEYLINSNLIGAINCLEIARKHHAAFIFLSTSRVYPFEVLNSLRYIETESRYALRNKQSILGASSRGINEKFPINGARSLYGATKLATEIIAHEYASMYNIKVIINRSGVIAGPWQMGKVDQGVFALWMAAHYFKKELSYIGFGGEGKQVRDVLHIDDLCELIDLQITNLSSLSNQCFNIGGGIENSLSLLEMTEICREITGNKISIYKETENRPADIKLYLSDLSKIGSTLSWKPKKSPQQVLEDIFHWIHDYEKELINIFC